MDEQPARSRQTSNRPQATQSYDAGYEEVRGHLRVGAVVELVCINHGDTVEGLLRTRQQADRPSGAEPDQVHWPAGRLRPERGHDILYALDGRAAVVAGEMTDSRRRILCKWICVGPREVGVYD